MRHAWWGFCLIVGLSWIPAFAGMTSGTKYNPQFGNALERARAQHAQKRWLDCVIRLSHPPTPQNIAQLKSTRFRPRSAVDTIVTGRIQARHVERFLKLPFVVSVEGGGMGGPKETRGLK